MPAYIKAGEWIRTILIVLLSVHPDTSMPNITRMMYPNCTYPRPCLRRSTTTFPCMLVYRNRYVAPHVFVLTMRNQLTTMGENYNQLLTTINMGEFQTKEYIFKEEDEEFNLFEHFLYVEIE